MEEYQSFTPYWRKFNYAKVVERMEELFSELNTAELRAKYIDEVSQTPAKEAAEGDADQEKTLVEETLT